MIPTIITQLLAGRTVSPRRADADARPHLRARTPPTASSPPASRRPRSGARSTSAWARRSRSATSPPAHPRADGQALRRRARRPARPAGRVGGRAAAVGQLARARAARLGAAAHARRGARGDDRVARRATSTATGRTPTPFERRRPAIPLFDLRISEEDLEAVAAVLRSGRLRAGEQVEAFEREFAAHLGVRHAIAVSSGTAALHLAYLAAGIGPGDEVIVPSITFAASAAAVIYCGGDAGVRRRLRAARRRRRPRRRRRAASPTARRRSAPCTTAATRRTSSAARAVRARLALIEDAAHSPDAVARRPHGRRVGARVVLLLLLQQGARGRRGRAAGDRRRRAWPSASAPSAPAPTTCASTSRAPRCCARA